jgi:hypothetical protein
MPSTQACSLHVLICHARQSSCFHGRVNQGTSANSQSETFCSRAENRCTRSALQEQVAVSCRRKTQIVLLVTRHNPHSLAVPVAMSTNTSLLAVNTTCCTVDYPWLPDTIQFSAASASPLPGLCTPLQALLLVPSLSHLINHSCLPCTGPLATGLWLLCVTATVMMRPEWGVALELLMPV